MVFVFVYLCNVSLDFFLLVYPRSDTNKENMSAILVAYSNSSSHGRNV